MKKRQYEMREEKYVNSLNYISKCYTSSRYVSNRSNLMKNEEMTERNNYPRIVAV